MFKQFSLHLVYLYLPMAIFVLQERDWQNIMESLLRQLILFQDLNVQMLMFTIHPFILESHRKLMEL